MAGKTRAKTEPKPKPERGRPRIDFDTATFEGLCEIHCTLREIARVMRVSEDTIERRCKEVYGLSYEDAFQRFASDGIVALRRAQMKAAVEGNTAMLVWLGKQLLGQREKADIKHEFEQLSDAELIARAKAAFGGDSQAGT